MAHLVWFRCDLRVHDHPALRAASIHGQPVMAIFIATPDTWSYHDAAAVKLDFIARNVAMLQDKLRTYNIPLLNLECKTFQDVPNLLDDFCKQHPITDIYFNQQYEIDEMRRDAAVEKLLTQQGIRIHRFHEQTLIPPGMILSNNDQPLKVFTPFKKKWLQWQSSFADLSETPLPEKQTRSPLPLPSGPTSKTSEAEALWPAGEEAAMASFEHFLECGIQHYHVERDFPAKTGTSKLSPYLAQGVISIKRMFARLNNIPHSQGKATWINELIWRDFYKHLLYLMPELCQSENFKTKGRFTWQTNPGFLEAWQQGNTGFPLIDAAMRELNTTGWMHNRMRMNTAMFLSKLLNLDWRLGERYFMQNLIDGDLAANNGGWQWAAGTGCDAAPYFRIFNPLLQSEKFDPQGEYIKRYCPELANFTAKAIHAPHLRNPDLAAETGYPTPIIDYKSAREAYLKSRKNTATE